MALNRYLFLMLFLPLLPTACNHYFKKSKKVSIEKYENGELKESIKTIHYVQTLQKFYNCFDCVGRINIRTVKSFSDKGTLMSKLILKTDVWFDENIYAIDYEAYDSVHNLIKTACFRFREGSIKKYNRGQTVCTNYNNPDTLLARLDIRYTKLINN